MAANRLHLQAALQKKYDRFFFAKDVLKPVFGQTFTLYANSINAPVAPNKSEQEVISEVSIYGKIELEDATDITCYEIILQPAVQIQNSKVAIQQYVRKLLPAGQAALINFISPRNTNVWRFTLVAKDTEITEKGIKEKSTNARRYTYLLGPNETCRTAAEAFEKLGNEEEITFEKLVAAFSVEKLSKAFFDEYTRHYNNFCNYLQESPYRKSVFNITIPTSATQAEKDKACKPIRDFTKKLLGRIVFLYFVQKKNWLGASDTNYTDGEANFIKLLFKQSGENEAFYSVWLSKLFFETLNKERKADDFTLPNGKTVKVPYLNGGLFDREEYDDKILTFPPELFHNKTYEDVILTDKNKAAARGFLDFLNAFNFTVHEDSPDDHTVAVDPEMLGHIFENLLEDNKDKGAYYTPKEIVHYMCQESLTEYLSTHLSKEYTVYLELGKDQLELFGNETRKGQLSLIEELGDKALNHDDVAHIVKHKDVSNLTDPQLKRIGELLDAVKICDPAIGSGAFPMGLLQEIFAIKAVIAYELNEKWKPAEVKENIIQNSIYGVDIEKGAVDIARLRFWLSLIVDEPKPKALPNLDYKIVVGNSLVSKLDDEIIDIDWETDTHVYNEKAKALKENIKNTLEKLYKKEKQYFDFEGDKAPLKLEIRNLKIDILQNQLRLMTYIHELKNASQVKLFEASVKEKQQQAENKLKVAAYNQTVQKLENLKAKPNEPLRFFDWKLDFPEIMNEQIAKNKGFDIVIGNPPYVQLQKIKPISEELKKLKFYTYNATGDIYCIFYEVGYSALKPNGVLAYITSNKWMRAGYGDKLRDFFINYTNPIKLIDFAGHQIFKTATVDANILLIKKEKNRSITQTCTIKDDYNSRINLSDYFRQNYKKNSFLEKKSWVINNEVELEIKKKIESAGKPLVEWDINIYRGILTGYNEAFIIDNATRDKLIKASPENAEIIRPILRGRDIQKYSAKSELYIIAPHNGYTNSKGEMVEAVDINKYPAIKSHLDKYWKELSKRQDKGKTPYNLRSCIYMEDFSKQKIIYPNMTKFLPFYFDCDGYYTNQKCFIITGKQLAFLSAFFNSSLFKYCFKDNFPELQGGTRELSKIFFEKLPVITISDELNLIFEEKVLEIQNFKRNGLNTKELEIALDHLIFELYDLEQNERDAVGFIEIK